MIRHGKSFLAQFIGVSRLNVRYFWNLHIIIQSAGADQTRGAVNWGMTGAIGLISKRLMGRFLALRVHLCCWDYPPRSPQIQAGQAPHVFGGKKTKPRTSGAASHPPQIRALIPHGFGEGRGGVKQRAARLQNQFMI
ncbi:MAG: hypothetical protein B6D39_11525 [Anaerolineae bacterium UTCFX2]|nr:MAG: hypothetical protein B6D39_11525 [Anaerolineae bacterium UTCFX2]